MPTKRRGARLKPRECWVWWQDVPLEESALGLSQPLDVAAHDLGRKPVPRHFVDDDGCLQPNEGYWLLMREVRRPRKVKRNAADERAFKDARRLLASVERENEDLRKVKR